MSAPRRDYEAEMVAREASWDHADAQLVIWHWCLSCGRHLPYTLTWNPYGGLYGACWEGHTPPHDCLGHKAMVCSRRFYGPITSETRAMPEHICLRCRMPVFDEDIVHVVWAECCKDFWIIGRCCEVMNDALMAEEHGRTPREFVVWFRSIHEGHCAKRCADCGVEIENPRLTWSCFGCGRREREETCGPHRCIDCFRLHRASGACPEEGKSAPGRRAGHACPFCQWSKFHKTERSDYECENPSCGQFWPAEYDEAPRAA